MYPFPLRWSSPRVTRSLNESVDIAYPHTTNNSTPNARQMDHATAGAHQGNVLLSIVYHMCRHALIIHTNRNSVQPPTVAAINVRRTFTPYMPLPIVVDMEHPMGVVVSLKKWFILKNRVIF